MNRGEINHEWKSPSVQQPSNQNKPHPGCRQIIFRKMQLRLSCSPVDETEAFVHQEPCIFCRMLSSRDASRFERNIKSSSFSSPSKWRGRGRRRTKEEITGNFRRNRFPYSMLVENGVMVDQIITPYLEASERKLLFHLPEFCETFQLKDHFCAKHGNRFKFDDQIFKKPPRRKNKNGKDIEYVMLGKLLEKMLKDGKDPLVFCEKLNARTRPFPAHEYENKRINKPETPLAEDPKYGKYFRRMKKCIKCEKEADARVQAKKGMRQCQTCNRFHHFTDERHCGDCHQFLGCDKCPDKNKTNCGYCHSEFCSNCREVFSCGSCGTSSCNVCLKGARIKFETCSHCNHAYCSDCENTFYCKLCDKRHCYYCVDGGRLDCKCGKIQCCAKCIPQKQCDICWKRKCLECYDMNGKMGCSMCGGSSCKKCDGVYKCEICDLNFCYACKPQHREDTPNNVCNECGPVFEQYSKTGKI